MKDWIKSSFRNRIFVTVLLVTLLPMLLCDIFIMQIAMSQSRRQLREQALEELSGIERQFDGLYDEVDSVTAGLADSIVVRSALRRGGSDSKLLYQVLYLATSGLRGSVDFNVYDSDGSRRYTSAVSLTDEKLPLHWGALRLAEESDGLSCQADEGGGLVMARASAMNLSARTTCSCSTGHGGRCIPRTASALRRRSTRCAASCSKPAP